MTLILDVPGQTVNRQVKVFSHLGSLMRLSWRWAKLFVPFCFTGGEHPDTAPVREFSTSLLRPVENVQPSRLARETGGTTMREFTWATEQPTKPGLYGFTGCPGGAAVK